MTGGPGPERADVADRTAEVGFVSTADRLWGAEQSLLTLVRELKRQGVRSALIAFSAELATIWSDEELGPVVLLTGRPEGRLQRNRVMLQEWLRGPRAQSWVFFNFDLLPIAPLMQALRPRERVYLDLHDYLSGSRGRFLLRRLSNACSGVICVSEFTAEQLPARVPRIVLYRPVQELAPRRPAPAEGDQPPTIGVIGRLDPEKEHALAIEAVARMHEQVNLVFRGAVAYGSESYREEIERHGGQLLAPRFAILDPTSQERALDGVDILLVCNPREPMGRTVVEAQLAGIPVVVPDTGGAAELVADGQSGLIYTAGDPDDLSFVLSRLVSDVGLATELARRAHAVALERNQPSGYAARYRQFIGVNTP
ncbi:glycosyltransferase family 4 protein [Micromonospora sp. DPT]|uniref:glycosyltransferase family 4 protein n=1 Tax=Micromonospora sp. DPT TaxID=3142975 RepID=UPI003208956D